MVRFLTKNWPIVVGVVFAMALLAFVFTPAHVIQLAFEGFPQPQGPVPDQYATLSGAKKTYSFQSLANPNRSIDKSAEELFSQSGGKALLIHHNGALAFEHYGIGVDMQLNSYSIVKSLVGALVLRAHGENRIASLQDPIDDYLPTLGDETFRTTPIIDFLRMTSGLAFEKGNTKSASGAGLKEPDQLSLNPFGDLGRLHMLGLESVNDQLVIQPAMAGRFSYQNINTSVLGALIAEIYQRPLSDILNQKIWQPAGAGIAHWRRPDRSSTVTAYCCLYATPRDWLRVGVYLLNNGEPNAPFLPDDLWRIFLGLDLPYEEVRKGKYGLHIRHDVLDRPGEPLQGPFAYMFGNGGQIIYLMPSAGLVVVRFGRDIQLLHSTLYSAWRTLSPSAAPPIE